MAETFFLEEVQILYGPDQPVEKGSVLVINGKIEGFASTAIKKAKKIGVIPKKVPHQLFAPTLVDPHSILEEPLNGRCENLSSLKNAASKAGYGQIAILPRSNNSRDSPDKLLFSSSNLEDVAIYWWGNFSQQSKGEELALHAELIKQGAIGLADDDWLIEISLLQKGLLLGEMQSHPILLAPRDRRIQGEGIVREGIETLRAGWNPDPIASEIFPLRQILDLHNQYPDKAIRIMNISTKESVSILKSSNKSTPASVCWWHLIADRSTLSPEDPGWRVCPSLGGTEDRLALIQGIKARTISSIAVHAIPLEEETFLSPPDKRPPGLSGHHLVLPSLWQNLIVTKKLSIEQLWHGLSFGASKMINSNEEVLKIGSKRWMLFDPNHVWTQSRYKEETPKASNQPWEGKKILGKVISCGLQT